MLTEIALSFGYASLFLWLIGRSSFFNDKVITNRSFQWLFIIKLIAGFGLFLVYTKIYPERKYADIFRYYDDSKIIYNSIFHHPYDFFRMMTGYHSGDDDLWQYYNGMNNWFNSELIFNDTRTMIRLTCLFRFIAAGTYYPLSIFFCFLAFIGLTAFYKAAVAEFKRNHSLIAIGVFLTPSILLWTSGVIKEAFLVFALGCMIYLVRRIAVKEGRLVLNIIATIFCMFFLLNIKSYMLFAMLPGMLTWYVIKSKLKREDEITFGNKDAYRKLTTLIAPFIIVYIIYFAMLYQFSPLFTHHPVPELMVNKQTEFFNLARTENAGSFVPIPVLEPNGYSLAVNAPRAVLFTLTRPVIGETKNPMMLLASLENAAIIILIIINFYFLLRKKCSFNGLSFILMGKLVIITLFCLIGWVTPILGAVVRYKVAALPFLMAILVCMSPWEKTNAAAIKLFRLN